MIDWIRVDVRSTIIHTHSFTMTSDFKFRGSISKGASGLVPRYPGNQERCDMIHFPEPIQFLNHFHS